MVKDAETHADDDRRQRELVEARNNAENAAYQAEKQLEELGDSVDDVLQGGDRGGDQGRPRHARVRGRRRDQRQDRGAADGLPQGVRADVRARPPQAQQADAGNGAGGRRRADADGSAEEEVVDAEVVDGEERSRRAERDRQRRAASRLDEEPPTAQHGEEEPAGDGDPEPRPRSRSTERPRRRGRASRRGGPLARASASATSTSTLAQRTQADFENYRKRAAQGGRGGRRAREERPGRASCCPWSTTSSGRWPRPRTGEQHLAEGVQLVHSELVAVLERNGVEPFDPAGEQFDPDPARGALDARARRAPTPGVVLDVVEKGYRLNGTVLRPARVVVSRRRADGRRSRTPTRCSASTRRPPTRRSRRPTASSRASTTRTEPGRRGGRGALQGDPGGLLDPVRPREARAVRLGRRHLRRRASTRARSARRPAAASAAASATSSPTSSAAAAAAARRAGRRPERGRDLETEVHISFEQAMEGAQVPVTRAAVGALPDLPRHRRQARHHAHGLQPLPGPRRRGRVARACSRSPSRAASAAAPAPRSRTRARPATAPGQTRQVKRYRVNIPAGVRDGSRVRLAGKGEAGRRGGPPGDLYVITRVADSPLFRRKGDNLEVEVPITIPEAIRGAHDRGADAERLEAHPRAPGHPARHRPAPARRGPAAARRQGPRRHPLPAGDRRAALALAASSARWSTSWPTVMDGNPRERILPAGGRLMAEDGPRTAAST